MYEAIRKHHRFLTSFDDIPYAVLLSNPTDDVVLRAETMNRYYKELRTYYFNAGNELQWLSQVLTFLSPQYDNNLVPSVGTIRDTLKKTRCKSKNNALSIIGILSNSSSE